MHRLPSSMAVDRLPVNENVLKFLEKFEQKSAEPMLSMKHLRIYLRNEINWGISLEKVHFRYFIPFRVESSYAIFLSVFVFPRFTIRSAYMLFFAEAE